MLLASSRYHHISVFYNHHFAFAYFSKINLGTTATACMNMPICQFLGYFAHISTSLLINQGTKVLAWYAFVLKNADFCLQLPNPKNWIYSSNPAYFRIETIILAKKKFDSMIYL